jgi:hypothetical protein
VGASKIINYNIMADNIFQKQEDKTPTWIKNRSGVKSCVPASIAQGLLKDRNRGFELCDPEFVPGEQVVPLDRRKGADGQERANTEKTYTSINKIVNGSHMVIDKLAKDKNISLIGCKTKKEKLEKLEAAGVLY